MLDALKFVAAFVAATALAIPIAYFAAQAMLWLVAIWYGFINGQL